MGVCLAVKSLAECVLRRRPSDARQLLQLELLRLMPMYSALRDLSIWSKAFELVDSTKQRKPPPLHTPKHAANLLGRSVWHKILR